MSAPTGKSPTGAMTSSAATAARASSRSTPVGERTRQQDLRALTWDLTVHHLHRSFARHALPTPAQAAEVECSGSLADVRLDATRHAINDIRAAVRRIDSGTYGTCQQCGRIIPADRMRARPTTRWCTVCQEGL